MMKSNPEKAIDHSVSIQDAAYNLFGDMLLEKETKEICEEIESEKGTKAEADMKDFFTHNEQKHLQIIERNCHGGKGGLIGHFHILQRIAQIAAVLIVCLALAGGIALAASPYVRTQIMRLLANVTPEYTELDFSVEKEMNIPSDWQGIYYLGVVPENAHICYLDSDEAVSCVNYSFEASPDNWILSFAEYDDEIYTRIDTEDAGQINSIINGKEVSITEKDGLITVYWNDGQRLLVLQTQNSSMSETITYVSNVIMVK